MSITATYSQDADDDDLGDLQELTLRMTHSGAGPYLVIETQRWAVDSVHEVITTITPFVDAVTPLFEAAP
jgi:hypothetical protein